MTVSFQLKFSRFSFSRWNFRLQFFLQLFPNSTWRDFPRKIPQQFTLSLSWDHGTREHIQLCALTNEYWSKKYFTLKIFPLFVAAAGCGAWSSTRSRIWLAFTASCFAWAFLACFQLLRCSPDGDSRTFSMWRLRNVDEGGASRMRKGEHRGFVLGVRGLARRCRMFQRKLELNAMKFMCYRISESTTTPTPSTLTWGTATFPSHSWNFFIVPTTFVPHSLHKAVAQKQHQKASIAKLFTWKNLPSLPQLLTHSSARLFFCHIANFSLSLAQHPIKNIFFFFFASSVVCSYQQQRNEGKCSAFLVLA